MMETRLPNLLLTPPLEVTESLRAYMYKAALANAFPRLYVGNALALAYSFVNLVENRDYELSQKLRYRLTPEPTTSGKASFFYLGEDQLPTSAMRTSARNVCPHCLSEEPWSRGEWELKAYIACEKHGVRLLENCDQCKRKLSWDRTELLHCFCGRSLTDIAPQRAQSWETRWSVQVGLSLRESISRVHRLASDRCIDPPMRLFKLLEMADVIRAGYYFASNYGHGSSPALNNSTGHGGLTLPLAQT
jgi:hypothetical protein